MFDQLNPFKSASDRVLSKEAEHQIYEKITQDIKSSNINKGVWAKAFAKSGGDETKQKAIYLELMFEYQKEKIKAEQEQAKIKRIQEAENRRKRAEVEYKRQEEIIKRKKEQEYLNHQKELQKEFEKFNADEEKAKNQKTLITFLEFTLVLCILYVVIFLLF